MTSERLSRPNSRFPTILVNLIIKIPMINSVDFQKLKPYKDDNKKSFELLCYHIAKRSFSSEGLFTPVDDSGGGDGVEFYLTKPDKSEFGWQAKFFKDTDRLNHGNRKGQIIKSLKKACEVHPNLKKWFLCTPSTFTPDETDWFKNELPKGIPDTFTSELELIHLNSADITTFLADPKFAGIAGFFFGTLELDIKWFNTKFQENFKMVENKYDPEVHSENSDCYFKLDEMLVTGRFLDSWVNDKKKIHQIEQEHYEAVEEFKAISRLSAEEEDVKSKFLKIENTIAPIVELIWYHIGQVNEILDSRDFEKLRDYKLSDVDGMFKSYFKAFDEILESAAGTLSLNQFYSIRHTVSSLRELIRDIFPSKFRFDQKELRLIGDANTGKTHLVCDYAKKLIDSGLPVIFIPGVRFTNKTGIEEALREILDLPGTVTFSDFLDSLDSCSEAFNCRLPIFLEGLNETTIQGKGFSALWENNITAFSEKILRNKNLVLITSCRPGYDRQIWGDNYDNTYDIYGFENTDDAIVKYFTKYKIKADLNFTSIEHFRHPIYLKLFCEIKNPKAANTSYTEVVIGEENLAEIFNGYLDGINKAIIKRSNLRKGIDYIGPILNGLAEYLWENNQRSVPIKDFYRIIDETKQSEVDMSDLLLQEGLILIPEWNKDGEVVRFTYDPLAGYLIAENLLSINLVESEKLSEYVTKKLFSNDYRENHPLFQDIRKFFALLMPQRMNKHLYQVSENKVARRISVECFFELPADKVQDTEIKYLESLLKIEGNREEYFNLSQKTIAVTTHPLNIKFWSQFLNSLSMAERDLTWTEFVRKNGFQLQGYVKQFEVQCRSLEPQSEISIARIHLVAEYIMWILSSTNRSLRNHVTRALYFYGIRFPDHFSEQTFRSLKINDPYISERTLAALYGSSTALSAEPASVWKSKFLPDIAKNIYRMMFAEGALYGTTHVLTRDYASSVIKIAFKFNPDLFTEKEYKRVLPPYADLGIRDWKIADDEFLNGVGGGPIHMDFGNYTIGHIVPDGHSYSNSSEKVKTRGQIYWRIYDLGYDKDRFAAAEKSVQNENDDYSRSTRPKVERYGKKYSWIAFYELSGYRRDLNISGDDSAIRTSDTDLDPTFPEHIRQHQLITEDLLSPEISDIGHWIKNGSELGLEKYIRQTGLLGEGDDWICLDAYINQSNKEVDRNISCSVRTLVVTNKDYARVLELLEKDKTEGKPLPDKATNRRVFAGEMSLMPEMCHSNWRDLSFTIEKRTEIIKPGDPEYRNAMPIMKFHLKKRARELRGITEGEDDDATTAKSLQSYERDVYVTEDFEILLPVMDYAWEKGDSVNEVGNGQMLSSELISDLALEGRKQTFDLFDIDNKKAAITIRYGDSYYENFEEFVFIRKDLLDKFLSANGYKMIWVLWGERRLSNYEGPDTHRDFFAKHGFESIRKFEKIVAY